MIELILKDIEDPIVRENFFRLSQFIDRQIWFDGDFQLFDITIPRETTNFKIKHGLTFIPADIIPLAVEGDYNYYFKYTDFDADYMYVAAAGPVRIRFLAGKLKDQIRNKLTANSLPFVSPGDIVGPASPGFVYSAVGLKSAGFWLTSGNGIPTNVVGIPVLFGNGVVIQAAVGSEGDPNYTIGIYQHTGNGIGLTQLGTFNIVTLGSKRVSLSFPVIYTSPDVQLACRIEAGNTNNLQVALVLRGTAI